MKKTGVYKIFCIENNSFYIGSCASPRGVENRIKTHFNLLNNNKHPNIKFQNTFNKYGEKSFTTVFIEEVSPQDCLNCEQYFIDLYKPNLNIAKAAKSPMKGRTHSNESKQKISNANRKNSRKFIRSLSYFAKQCNSNGGSFILCHQTQAVYFGVNAAAKLLNINKANIWKVLNYKIKQCNGYTFEKYPIPEHLL